MDAEHERLDTGIKKHLWTHNEVYRAMGTGVFGGEPLDWLKMELLEGELFEFRSPTPPQIYSEMSGRELLQKAFGEGHHIRSRHPLEFDAYNEPEPDLSVVIGDIEAYPEHHPGAEHTQLIVEIPVETLRYDRYKKAQIYAKFSIPDYWILLLKNRTLEVRRDPAPSQKNGKVWEYRDIQIYQETDSVTPLHASGAAIKVADLLPEIKSAPHEGRLQLLICFIICCCCWVRR